MTAKAHHSPLDVNRLAPAIEMTWSRRAATIPGPLLDLLAGAAFTAVALGLWVGAGYIDEPESGLVGPAGFPRGIALIFGALSLLMAFRGAYELYAGKSVETVKVREPLAVFAMIGLVAVYPVLITSFGYYLGTGPWLVALLVVTGNRRPVLILALCAGFLIFTKLVFDMLIGIPLP